MIRLVKTIFSIAAALLLAGSFSSCQTDWLATQEADGFVLHLAVSGQTAVVTKATRPGEDLYNENSIGEVADFFFFRDDSPDAVLRHSVRAEVQTGGDVTIPISKGEMLEIFGNLGTGSSCSVLVVTNYDGTYPTAAQGESLTRADIENQVLAMANWLNLPQSKFVMISEKNTTLVLQDASDQHPLRNGNQDPTINLERVAVKLTFEISVKDSVDEGEDTWTPVTTGITAYLVNAMRKAELSGDPMLLPPDPKSADGQAQLYTYEGRAMRALTTSSGEPVLNPDGENRPLYAIVRGTTTEGVFTPVRDADTGDMVQEPFYAYPSRWDTGSMAEPYIKLVIPWNTGKRTKQFYYKIPFAQRELVRNTWYKVVIDVQALGGEEDYAPTLTAQYYVAPWSGSVNADSDPDASTLPTSIIAARYLSVPTKEFILYNLDDFSIPINSSHDVEVVGFQVGATGIYTDAHKNVKTNYVGDNPRIYNPFAAFSEGNSSTVYAVRPDYSAATPKAYSPAAEMNVVAKDYAGTDWNIKVVSRKEIKFQHALNRDMTQQGYDVAPYTIRFRVRHADAKTQYYEDVTIEQRPPVVIVPQTNSGGNAQHGYAFVNGGQNNGGNVEYRTYNPYSSEYLKDPNTGYYFRTYSQDGSWTGNYNVDYDYIWSGYFLGSAPNEISESASNKNFNMYVIETSVLPSSGKISEYMLGDPRSDVVDNIYGSSAAAWSNTKPDWDGNNRGLTYYYPVNSSVDYNFFIAPIIRIASSFGATVPVTRDNAFRRCASYQEDGYPAGRWRVPTRAEIEYIIQLNADRKIPVLLGEDPDVITEGRTTTYYWCNSGYVSAYVGEAPVYQQGTTRDGDTYVRCVYDDWYWGASSKDRLPDNKRGTFTWGDQARSTVTMKED